MVRAFLISTLIGIGCYTAALAGPSWTTKKGQSSIEIDRIDIQGVKAFTEQVLEGALDIGPGDQLERPKVVRTEENIQALYRAHGYEGAKVQSRLVRKRVSHQRFETVLEFEIKEGDPTRIAEVKVVPYETNDDSAKKEWANRERKLQASVTLHPGDILDQEKITDTRRAIQELLASEQYIGARIEKVFVNPAQAPSVPAGISPDAKTGRWVSLKIQVQLGDRVSFGFRGNTVFSRGHLSSLVEEQRLLGLGKDYIGVIRNRLEEEYRASGYAQVRITNYSIELPNRSERKVVFVIQEGPRVKIDSIDFDGNAVFLSPKLREKFYSRASGLVQKNIYVEKDVQKAAELLVEWMKEKGYLAAKLVTITPYYPPKPRTQERKSSVRLLIYLYEGDQTLVQNISIQGLNVLKNEEIEKVLGVEKGEPLNLYSFSEGIEQLKKIYRDRGYLGFRILNEGSENLIQYYQENHYADIAIQLDEGPQYRVSRIEIEGLVNTQERVVQREITLESGGVLSEQELIQTERQIRRLGIFSGVSVRLLDDENEPESKVVRITLHEAERGILTWGPGFRNDLGVRGFGQLAYTNLWGLNHTASFTANINRRYNKYNFLEGQAQFAYAWPWFGLPDLTFRPSVSAGQTQYIRFSAQTVTASATWEKPLLTRPNITGTFSYTFERVRQFRAEDKVDEQQLRIASVSPKISIDLRDNPLVPTSGFFATTSFDLAHPLLGSQMDPYPIGFYRLQFRSDYHLPIWKGIAWYFSFRTGHESALDVTKNSAEFQNRSVDSIPLIKQFALGGIGSVRGYQELEINKPSDARISGSLSYVNYRTQLDFPFSGALKVGVFLDAANLLVDDYSLGRLKYGTGFGFHYQTPVGAVNFDWGFKIDPPPNANPYVIHFSVGVI